MSETQSMTIREQIAAWERKGYAGVLDDAGHVHDGDSLESALSQDELDAPHDVPVYGWTGPSVAFGAGRAVGLTAQEVEVGSRLAPTSLARILEALAAEVTP